MRGIESTNSVLKRLQDWYASQCNGDWEHQFGIRIETVDNPGWSVEIDLVETEWQDTAFAEVRTSKNTSDWIICFKRGSRFVGSGDPSKLTDILAYFLTVVNG